MQFDIMHIFFSAKKSKENISHTMVCDLAMPDQSKICGTYFRASQCMSGLVFPFQNLVQYILKLVSKLYY